MTGFLRRPLPPGAAVLLWRLGATVELRYDVADEPMAGDMDPFFFLTRHKNFVPHEYPCRRHFAAAHRGRRPEPAGEFAPVRNVLPFGAERLDLSGFWFRPTRLSTWAEAVIVAAEAGEARLQLATCGGAVLFVNGAEAGWISGYVRNLEAAVELSVPLRAGANEVRVFLDDLAERDTRYTLRLGYLAGPPAEQALPVADPAAADAVVAALDDLRTGRPVADGGELALVIGRPLPVDATLAVAVAGDFISHDRMRLALPVPAGTSRVALGDAAALPADFRMLEATLGAGGFTASRALGVEIVHPRAAPPDTLAARIEEALEAVATGGEPDTVTALARLATGRAGAPTDAMIAASLGAIEDCHDCADFLLVPLLHAMARYGEAIGPDVRDRAERAILGYRYWMDEPGNDVQWYFSENHALLFHTAAYLAGGLLPEARFVRSGRPGRAQSEVGRERVRAWLDHFAAWEMAEFNSAPYFPIDLAGLTALFALAPDADVRARAQAAIVRLFEIVARSAHHGILTGAQGRSYEHTLRAARSLELSAMGRLLWGTAGEYGRRFHALPQLALCLSEGLALPEEHRAVAAWTRPDAQEWCFAQGKDRIAKLYHYKTADVAMGSVAGYRWGEWGYQETLLQLRLGTNPDAAIFINHPGERIPSGHGRPSFWGGSGSVPRVQQYRGLAVLEFAVAEGQPDFTHAYFPRAVFDEALVEGPRALARCGSGVALLRASAELDVVARGPTAGIELSLPGRGATWIVRVGRARGVADFAARFGALSARREGERLVVDDPEYGRVVFDPDATVAAQGERIDPARWTIAGEARIIPVGGI